jgi:actin-related protein
MQMRVLCAVIFILSFIIPAAFRKMRSSQEHRKIEREKQEREQEQKRIYLKRELQMRQEQEQDRIREEEQARIKEQERIKLQTAKFDPNAANKAVARQVADKAKQAELNKQHTEAAKTSELKQLQQDIERNIEAIKKELAANDYENVIDDSDGNRWLVGKYNYSPYWKDYVGHFEEEGKAYYALDDTLVVQYSEEDENPNETIWRDYRIKYDISKRIVHVHTTYQKKGETPWHDEKKQYGYDSLDALGSLELVLRCISSVKENPIREQWVSHKSYLELCKQGAS